MTTLTVTGMTCGHCQKAVTEALEGVDGVTKADVDLETGVAKVEGMSDTNALISAVEEEGYSASAPS